MAESLLFPDPFAERMIVRDHLSRIIKNSLILGSKSFYLVKIGYLNVRKD